MTAAAQAHPNIAFIKYWGKRDQALRLPANGSISMNLAGLSTRTSVSFRSELRGDQFSLGGREMQGTALERVVSLLDLVRQLAGVESRADVVSENTFPASAGIASSASAFAALALAASKAAGLELTESELSRLARRGSGSACRSIPAGFTEWSIGTVDEDSYAVSIANPDHWSLMDCITIVSDDPKATGSSTGHALAASSPFQAARVADAPRRLQLCRRAILECNFEQLAAIVELDSEMMHAVMRTSTPALHFLAPTSLAVIHSVRAWRRDGLSACYTVDAGANVHVICTTPHVHEVEALLRRLEGVREVLVASVGGPARLL